MTRSKHAGNAAAKAIFCAALSVLMLIITGCSGVKQAPGQPFLIPFESDYITTPKRLYLSTRLDHEDSTERDFLSITHQNHFFENRNSTAEVRVVLNRKAVMQMPEIGEWSTISTGNCLSDDAGVQCYTAHIDCHLIRTTSIPTGKRSLLIIRVRNNSREPQELCKQWNPLNLTPEQLEEVKDFNRTSDSYFQFVLPKPSP